MENQLRRTKIVATIGPASRSPEVIRDPIRAGMNVARLNFSHGNRKDRVLTVENLRASSEELDKPVTLIQHLQGSKVRAGQPAGDELRLRPGETVELVPAAAMPRSWVMRPANMGSTTSPPMACLPPWHLWPSACCSCSFHAFQQNLSSWRFGKRF